MLSPRFSARVMLRAAALAELGRGRTGTNPLVGAVVVRDGRVVGEGWHARFGGPHAEVLALAAAGMRARGASLVVTLEPCSRTGKTPPCTRAIIAAGIREVVVGLADPLERGRGLAALRQAGIRSRAGVLATAILRQNESWIHGLRTSRPFVTLKIAETADGRMADGRGKSKWITSPRAREWTRGLRSRVDAILVGSRTVLVDDPRLTAPGTSTPLRVVADAVAATPPTSRIVRNGPVMVACTRSAARPRRQALLAAGADLCVLPGAHGGVDLRALMRALYTRGVGSVLCEGGSSLAGALLDARLVDRAIIVIAPRLLGGRRSLPSVLGAGRPLGRAISLQDLVVRRFGSDVCLDGRVRGGG